MAKSDLTSDSKKGAVVLLSAGLDSTYNLIRALGEMKVSLIVTFDYGQRAAGREVERAGRLAGLYKIPHQVVDLPWFANFSKSGLVGGGLIPRGTQVKIDDLKQSFDTAKSVWVPNRNGILLNIAAGFAEGINADYIIPGFNLEEAQTFPDNTEEYLESLNQSFKFSTNGQVTTFCFSTKMNKTEIVKDGLKLGLDLALLWPCYFAEVRWCGECESCLRFKRAVESNGWSFSELQKRSAN